MNNDDSFNKRIMLPVSAAIGIAIITAGVSDHFQVRTNAVAAQANAQDIEQLRALVRKSLDRGNDIHTRQDTIMNRQEIIMDRQTQMEIGIGRLLDKEINRIIPFHRPGPR